MVCPLEKALYTTYELWIGGAPVYKQEGIAQVWWYQAQYQGTLDIWGAFVLGKIERQIEDAARVGQQSKVEQAFLFCGRCSEKIVEEMVKVWYTPLDSGPAKSRGDGVKNFWSWSQAEGKHSVNVQLLVPNHSQ